MTTRVQRSGFIGRSLESSVQATDAPVQQYGAVDGEQTVSDPQRATGCCRSAVSAVFRHLTMFTALGLGTYVGVAARIGLTEFSVYNGILSDFSSFWAQLVGTFIMGLAGVQKEASFTFLYTIVTTGVCGSMTTFSSWNVEASKVLLQLNDTSLQPLHHSINGGRIVGFMTILLLGVGMPVSVFILGKRISSSLPVNGTRPALVALHRKRPWLFPMTTMFFSILVTSIIVAICLYTKYYSFLFSLLFGGPGTYIRWRLSALNKTNLKYVGNFPIGTFLVNIIGSFILACVLVIINYISSIDVTIGSIPLAMLNGVAVGFCGSLTTVSTFVSQICSLSLCMSLCYAFISLVVSQVVTNTVFLVYQALV